MSGTVISLGEETPSSATLSGRPVTGHARVKQPDRLDFDAFYTANYRAMVRLAYVLVDTPEQAEEVTQDAFAKLLPKFGRLRDPEGYLRVSVMNGSRSALRRRRVSRDRWRALADRGDAPLGDDVIDAVQALPEPQRSAVILRYYLDLSEREIASTLGIREGTVKSTLSRARARLREVLR